MDKVFKPIEPPKLPDRFGYRETFHHFTTPAVQFAYLWFEKELELLKIKTQKNAPPDTKDTTEVQKRAAVRALHTVVDWLLGGHVGKWYIPSTHTTIVNAVVSDALLTEFVFFRLPLLASAFPSLGNKVLNENPAFQFFGNMRVLPLSRVQQPPQQDVRFGTVASQDFKPRTYQTVEIGLPPSVLESAVINYSYAESVFSENHWLLLLLFCLASAQIYGLDHELLTAE